MFFKINAVLSDHNLDTIRLIGQADYKTANAALGDALRMCDDSGYTIQRLVLSPVESPHGFYFRSVRPRTAE